MSSHQQEIKYQLLEDYLSENGVKDFTRRTDEKGTYFVNEEGNKIYIQ
jgi:hypothetical protein